MGKILPFVKRVPQPSAQVLTEQDASAQEETALASISPESGVGMVRAAFSQAELDSFIRELDAMDDPEEPTP